MPSRGFGRGLVSILTLALAAYNAGEGRVGRALKASGATTFSEVAAHLPSETRLYVPKVLATVARREKVADPTRLPPPKVEPRAVAELADPVHSTAREMGGVTTAASAAIARSR